MERPKIYFPAIIAGLEAINYDTRRILPPSPNWINNPNADLCMPVEIQDYLERMCRHAGGDFALSRRIAEDLRGTAIPKEDLEAVIIIPVAAHQEYQAIFETLQQYEHQDRVDNFEIVLFLNNPAKYPVPQEVLDDIETYKAQSDLAIRTASHTYYGSLPEMGTIRKNAWDAVAYDLASRDIQQSVLGISNDYRCH